MPKIELWREGEPMTLAKAHGRDFALPCPARPLIVHLVRQFLPDRDGRNPVAMLCRQLSRHYRIRVVTCEDSDVPPGGKLAHETVGDIEIVRLAPSGSGFHALLPEVFRQIADADLVHVHGLDFGFDALAWGRFVHRRPLVATLDASVAPATAGEATGRPWFELVTRRSARAYRHIACTSHQDYRLFETIVGERATLLGKGADIARFAGCAALDARRRIVALDRMCGDTEMERLLGVMQVLAPRHPDWHLDIIGTPAGRDSQALAADIRARGLSRHVALHGAADDCAIRNIIARASLFASASEDDVGHSVGEPMSAGLLPVLHSNDAFRTLAKTHPALMLTDFSDARQSAQVLEAAFARLLCQGAGIREELIGIARSCAWDKVAERYGALYDAALPLPDLMDVPQLGRREQI